VSELALDSAGLVDRDQGRAWQTAIAWLAVLPASSAGEIVTVEVANRMVVHDRVARMFYDTTLNLIPCAFLALSLLGSGLTRRDVFVARGDLRAPARTPWGVVSWGRLGPVITLVLAAGLAVQLVITLRPDIHLLGRAVAALPLAIAFAALNAAQEEFRFRSVFLARLLPVVGTTHALLVSSLLFGLEHWFGHPSGPTGVLLAGFAGYVWGRSMVDTGGSAWAWLIHAAPDVVIFSFLVAANR
jgi:membrane protease YdiL (CAAX protease family)